MAIIMVLMIAVSLSMDAFSLSLAYGTLGLKKKKIISLSIVVGIYHFFMPLLGMNVGELILKILPINPDLIVLIVLSVIGLEMIIESFKDDKEVKDMSFIELIAFGLAVSIDSFSVGLGLRALYEYPIISSLFFSLSSFIFTYLGLKLGKTINDKVGKISTLLGGIVLIIIGILYML